MLTWLSHYFKSSRSSPFARRGLGTFVRRDVIDYDVRSLVSFTEKARAAGEEQCSFHVSMGSVACCGCSMSGLRSGEKALHHMPVNIG